MTHNERVKLIYDVISDCNIHFKVDLYFVFKYFLFYS